MTESRITCRIQLQTHQWWVILIPLGGEINSLCDPVWGLVLDRCRKETGQQLSFIPFCFLIVDVTWRVASRFCSIDVSPMTDCTWKCELKWTLPLWSYFQQSILSQHQEKKLRTQLSPNSFINEDSYLSLMMTSPSCIDGMPPSVKVDIYILSLYFITSDII